MLATRLLWSCRLTWIASCATNRCWPVRRRWPTDYGSSCGAIAAQFAARHPQRVSHLILYGAYARGFGAAVGRFVSEGGVASLYDGLIPLMIRQILFGMIKFLVFDTCADAILAALPSLRRAR